MKIHDALIAALTLGFAVAPAEARELVGDRGVKPGDRITLTMVDGTTGRTQTVTAVVNGTASVSPAPMARETTVVFRQVGTPMEFIAIDPATRRLTVLDAEGDRKILYVDEAAVSALSALEPGERFFLSYRFNQEARAEALIHTWPPAVTHGAEVSVLAADPAARTLVFRNAGGERHTLAVEPDAARELRGLRSGDTVLIAYRDDHVVAITRK
jgi:hypothetical protein